MHTCLLLLLLLLLLFIILYNIHSYIHTYIMHIRLVNGMHMDICRFRQLTITHKDASGWVNLGQVDGRRETGDGRLLHVGCVLSRVHTH